MTLRQYIRASIALGADVLAYASFAMSFLKEWYDQLPEDYQMFVSITRWGLIILFTLVVAYYVMIWIIRKKLKAAGTHGIECNFTNYYNYKIANRSKRILIKIHKSIYHEKYKVIKEIEENSYKQKNDIKKSVISLLESYRNALNDTFNLDLSIEIKLVKSKGTDKILQPYLFVPSSKELEIGDRRQKNYFLKALDSDDITDYVKKSQKYAKKKGSDEFLTNSAFDFVLSSTTTYWMSNDLEADTSKGLFFTSSDNLTSHYKSMAVFAIIPPAKAGETNLPIDGLLIFDTIETGVFSEIECKLMMGYMAHCIYEIFNKLSDEK